MDWFFLAFISALLSATAAVSQKKVLFSLSAFQFSFAVSFLSMIISIPFFFFIDFNTINLTNLAVLFLKSILGALAFLCVMMTIKELEISSALPLMVLTPGLVAFFAFFILGESLSLTEVIGMALLLIGTYMMETKNVEKIFTPFKVFFKSNKFRFIIYALLLFTTTSILDKILLSRYKLPPEAFMGFQHFFMAILFLFFSLFHKGKLQLNKFGKNLWLWILFIAIITVGYRYSQIEAIKIAPVALVLAVKRISVFLASVAGGKIFNEKNLLYKSIAIGIMVIGAIMIAED